MVFGILNVDKPQGCTSRDVVNRVQRLVRPAKVGHAGTLDPLATGVLLVCVGAATRLVPYLQRMRKRYRVVFRFGWRSDTDDLEGQLEACPAPPPDEQRLGAALRCFRGEIQQVPPVFSAVKVRGQRAYALARRQEPCDLSARRVVIHELQLVRYAYPDVELDLTCSSGTYVRSLGRDLAQQLGTSAVMASLVRTAIGHFSLETAVRLDELEGSTLENLLRHPREALFELTPVAVDDAQAQALRQGRSVPGVEPPTPGLAPGAEAAALAANGALVAILEYEGHARWRPVRCFSAEESGK